MEVRRKSKGRKRIFLTPVIEHQLETEVVLEAGADEQE